MMELIVDSTNLKIRAIHMEFYANWEMKPVPEDST